MIEEKFWPCFHISNDYGRGKWIFEDENKAQSVDGWQVCPVCQAKRPPEPLKLAQILFEAFQSKCKIPMNWENSNSDLIKRGSQAQAVAVVKLIKQTFSEAIGWQEFIDKLDKML